MRRIIPILLVLASCAGPPPQGDTALQPTPGMLKVLAEYQELRPQDGSKGGALPAYVCVPTEVTGVRQRDTVVNYMKSHPDSANRQAAGVVADAFRDAFACR